jgi:hypothetical protein
MKNEIIVNELYFKIAKENDGLSAYCDHIDVGTKGKDFEQIKEGVRKAITEFYKDYPKDETTQITIKFKWPADLVDHNPNRQQIRLA